MSNVSKGRKVENLAAEILRDEGYQVHQTIRSRWHNNDVFGCFDIVATDGNYLRFIQVTSDQYSTRKSKELDAINLPNTCGDKVTKEFWVYRIEKKTGRRKFKIYLNADGKWYHARTLYFEIPKGD